MGRPLLARSKTLLWASKRGECSIHKLAQPSEPRNPDAKEVNEKSWVPHPRSGIYVPKGHEKVMDDVPSGAASFTQPYWFRSNEGVDKSFPEPFGENY